MMTVKFTEWPKTTLDHNDVGKWEAEAQNA